MEMQQTTNQPAPKQMQVNLRIENAIKLDPKDPIPINYGGSTVLVGNNKEYIPFMGKDDNLPNLLLEARLTSPTQNACISSIASFTIGKGLSVVDVESPDSVFLSWQNSVNQKRQSLNKLLKMAVDGERTHGNCFVEVKRGDLNGKKFLKVFIHNMLECRLSKENDEGYPETVLISKKFAKKGLSYRAVLKDATEIPLWSDNPLDQTTCWKKNDDGTESTMLHFKNDVSGIDHYGLPASIAGLRHQVLEGKSAQYNIDNFENNMVLGGMLIFKSSMTQEEALENGKNILLSHMGEGKTGRIAVLSSESGMADVDFKTYETQKEGSFIEFDKRNEEKIIASNNWDSTLAGINRSSSMGNGSTYIRSIIDVKEAVLIKPLRQKLIDEIITPLALIYSEWMKAAEVAKYKFQFMSDMPFSFLGDLKPEQFMKVNEARELAGLDPDEKNGEKYLSENVKQNNNAQNKPITEEGADNNG